jgi:circadian clock protein KaiB
VLAQRNLKEFCEQFYPGNYQIQLVDVLLSPERAWTEGITVTPMLLRLSPLPCIKIMGNLSDTQQLSNVLSRIND